MSALLAVTPGMGIGPEVTAAALRLLGLDTPEGTVGFRVVLVGRREAMDEVGFATEPVDAFDRPGRRALPMVDPGDEAEPTEVAAIRLSVAACLDGRAAGLVTGPIHKARLVERGFAFRGHTDFIGHLCGSTDEVMAFAGGELRVALVTTHIALADVPRAVTRDRVRHVAEVAGAALRDDLGLGKPRLAVCGLNPHAGEDGLLGREEIEQIGPACDDLRGAGWAVIGPVSAETAFLAARRAEVDLVVAMYHDQGLAPLKAVDFGRSVNWTLGLPILRTSVDHGTADDLIGTGRADPSSMVAALRLAMEVAARRAAPLSAHGSGVVG